MRAICLLLPVIVPAMARADVVHGWNEVALHAIQRNSTPPPLAARALAMMHVAIYDAVNSIEPTHQSFRVYVPDSPTTSRESAAAQAAFRVLWELYPNERERLEMSLAASLTRVPDGPAKSAGIRLGDIVAARIIAWRNDDGSQRSIPYMPGTQPGQWRPTPPDYAPAMLPGWSAVTPFGITYASQFRPAFPPELNSAEYTRDFQEVKMIGAVNSAQRDPDQTEIAHFWADGPGTVTPPGHWNRIALTVARSRNLSVHENARLFALLNVALADAAIVCWDMKYACNFWRPVTAIQEAHTDGNDQTVREADWRPLLPTPPFPSCTSGHSTFSGAASHVLASFFGRDDIEFTDMSSPQRSSRTYARFSQAAEEAGRSRIYGGIHFQFDNRGGLESGRAVAQYIFDRYLKPLGTPPTASTVTQTAFRPASDDDGISSWKPVSNEQIPVLCYEPIIYTYPLQVAAPQTIVTYEAFYGW
jgi:hypothetical protein